MSLSKLLDLISTTMIFIFDKFVILRYLLRSEGNIGQIGRTRFFMRVIREMF